MIPSIKVLSDQEMIEIDRASREVLQEVGVHVAHEEALEIYKQAGARVDFTQQIVKIPSYIIDDALSKCSPSILLHGRDGVHPLILGGKRSYFGTLGIATLMLDLETGKYRPLMSQDMADFVRLADVLDPPHFVLIPATPNDVPTEVVDLYEFKIMLTNTKKHFFAEAQGEENLKKIIAMGQEVAGSLEALQERPFFTILICLTSPLSIRQDAAELIIGGSRAGLPLMIESGNMCGGTAPATLASTLIGVNAEELSSFVLAKSVNPAVPLMYCSWSRILDMKSAGVANGGPEFGLLRIGTTQMAKFYGLPSGGGGILADSKLIDAQFGIEKLGTALLPALAGTNFIAGMGVLADENALSLEALVIDHEIAGYVSRVLQGVEVNDETTDITPFLEAGPRGSFVELDHTLKHYRRELWMPEIFDRELLAEDMDPEQKGLRNLAKEYLVKALERYTPPNLPEDIDSKLDAIINQ